MTHSKNTLKNWDKEKLIDYILDLEHNNENLKKNFEIQYKNCMQIVEDMNILNKTIKNIHKDDNSNPYYILGGNWHKRGVEPYPKHIISLMEEE